MFLNNRETEEMNNQTLHIELPERFPPIAKIDSVKLNGHELVVKSTYMVAYEQLKLVDSAVILAKFALEHHSSGAQVLANFLISLENNVDFAISSLTKLDANNKQLVMNLLSIMNTQDKRPSHWMNVSGYDGKRIMLSLQKNGKRRRNYLERRSMAAFYYLLNSNCLSQCPHLPKHSQNPLIAR